MAACSINIISHPQNLTAQIDLTFSVFIKKIGNIIVKTLCAKTWVMLKPDVDDEIAGDIY